jgi:hypothetical protein
MMRSISQGWLWYAFLLDLVNNYQFQEYVDEL